MTVLSDSPAPEPDLPVPNLGTLVHRTVPLHNAMDADGQNRCHRLVGTVPAATEHAIKPVGISDGVDRVAL